MVQLMESSRLLLRHPSPLLRHISLDYPLHIDYLAPLETSTDLRLFAIHRGTVVDITILIVTEVTVHIGLATTILPTLLHCTLAGAGIHDEIRRSHPGLIGSLMKLTASLRNLRRSFPRDWPLPRRLALNDELWTLTAPCSRDLKS
jgi:hypothetical protein